MASIDQDKVRTLHDQTVNALVALVSTRLSTVPGSLLTESQCVQDLQKLQKLGSQDTVRDVLSGLLDRSMCSPLALACGTSDDSLIFSV
jgi:hypothetical protein